MAGTHTRANADIPTAGTSKKKKKQETLSPCLRSYGPLTQFPYVNYFSLLLAVRQARFLPAFHLI